MKDVKIISIDNRGRIVLPLVTRKNLGITTDSQLMLVSDSETKEIRITPVGISKEDKPIKFRITMADEPGSLAKIATVFGEFGISLMWGESIIIEKSKTAIWTVISPTPKNITMEELREGLIKNGKALNVDILPFE
jgi:bifunctional DNA-binding transcriptional regulator/antitoxin component of YhaV-PrlF toxin-antitoxin module